MRLGSWLVHHFAWLFGFVQSVQPEFWIFFYVAQQPLVGQILFIRAFTIILRHTTLGRCPLGEWSVRRRDLFLTTHTRNIHGPAGIRTLYRSKRAAADPRMRWQIRNSTVKLAYNGTAMHWIFFPLQAGSVLCWYLKLKILGAESFPLETGFRLRQVTPYFCWSWAFRFISLPVLSRSSYHIPVR